MSSQAGLWVLRAQCGDREALELLLRHVQPPLRNYLRGIVGGADVDDVLQEVLLLIYRKLWSLQNAEAFRSWAFRIASRDRAEDSLRHSRHENRQRKRDLASKR